MRTSTVAHGAAALLALVGPALVVVAAASSPQGTVDALTRLSVLASLRSTLLATTAACAAAIVIGAAAGVVGARGGTAAQKLVLAASFVGLAVPMRITLGATADLAWLDGLPAYALVMATGFGFVAMPLLARPRARWAGLSVARAIGFGAALVAWRALANVTAAQAFGIASVGAVARWRAAQPLSAAEAPAFAALQMALCVAAAAVAWRLRPGRSPSARHASARALDATLLLGAACPPAATAVALRSVYGGPGLPVILALCLVPWLLAAATLVLRAKRGSTGAPSPPS